MAMARVKVKVDDICCQNWGVLLRLARKKNEEGSGHLTFVHSKITMRRNILKKMETLIIQSRIVDLSVTDYDSRNDRRRKSKT